MRILIFILFISFTLFAANFDIQASYAVAVFHENGTGENMQHKQRQQQGHNGISIYNKQKIYIAEELTFKHYNVSKGYFEVKINDKIYDTKVFVK